MNEGETVRKARVAFNRPLAHAWLIAATVLYSTGHWIGGTVAVVVAVSMLAVA